MFLPLQEDVFPDTDDFGRVFRNNAVMSALGIPQITAIMGMCVAGGAYLPVMCDHILMTEGSGLFLAGPALVQAAIGQKITAEPSIFSVWNRALVPAGTASLSETSRAFTRGRATVSMVFTYQQLFTSMRRFAGAEHEAYLRYLADRYFLALRASASSSK